ncbi:hypothetical protein GPZ77_02495 [Streptomyces sp. QHH-9511]|nr:hypothetical protein GPZ77_02495 [Streptomyces sp. QHH-9511]
MMVDLTDLAKLPGAVEKTFEALTRAIVSRRYGALGTLRERRNQPGVEFYLPVEHPGVLGNPGRVWGWSCKWLILNNRNELSRSQREQIEDSVTKAIKYVDNLTDFVLCLPQRPAKDDEAWIDSLGPDGVTIRQWYTENFDAELSGHDELRSTFFGELVLTPDQLANVHKRSVAPIAARWTPQLHTSHHVERDIDRALLRPQSFLPLQHHLDSIGPRIQELRASLDALDTHDREAGMAAADDLDRFVDGLREIIHAASDLRPSEVRERLASQQPPTTSPRTVRRLVIKLRNRRRPEALAVTGIGADVRDIVGWLHTVQKCAEAPMLAVAAPAGQGKTHLAAQLTSPTGQPTAGLFIQGSGLRIGKTLDDLVRRVPGLRVDRFEDLLEALNSAGNRAGCRVPLIIDGLNEAERPSEWQTLLAELAPAMSDYPYVAVIVTLRNTLAEHALPAGTVCLDLAWHRPEVADIIRVYFDHYRIDAADAWLPIGNFHNPLFVRMYCEAANHERRVTVGAEALPQSLIGVFELYRNRVAERLEHDPARILVPADQIKRNLAALARHMWAQGVRKLSSDDARAILDVGQQTWDESLFRRLVEEGVLFREEIKGSDDTECGFLFDRFAGYLIADAILARTTYEQVDDQLADAMLWRSLMGEQSHPLGEDVTVGLVALLPRRFTKHHLWRVAPAEHRSDTLAQELETESGFLDDETVDALVPLAAHRRPDGSGRRHVLSRLWEVRRAAPHRLNATFLDRVLRHLPLPQRDLHWTEWVRHSSEQLTADLERAIDTWSHSDSRTEIDDLDAQATAWLLTSTNKHLRDLATKALQRYGRPHPKRLFDLVARMLDVDDPYITERLVGAAFGAASVHQMPDPDGPFEHSLQAWLDQLRGHFLDGGTTPTSHEQLREYVRAAYEFAANLHPAAVPDGVDPLALTFATTAPAPEMDDDDPHAEECARTFGMDFENYVIGAAINGRDNYQFDHPAYRKARAEVMARIWELGWREADFGTVEEAIVMRTGRYSGMRAPVERYGKKYGWIAYHEMVGRLVDAGRAPAPFGGSPRQMPDIDPSFPTVPPVAPMPLPEWAPKERTDSRSWLTSGMVELPEALWSPQEIHQVEGGWLLAEGYLEHRLAGRTVFGFFRTLLLDGADVEPARQLISEQSYLGNEFFSSLPTIRDVLAAEMPWSPRLAVRFDDDDPSAVPHRALRRDWQDDGIRFGQLAVEFGSESTSETGLGGAYDVPSYEFADQFKLRQLPGTVDLVSLDGRRAAAVVRAVKPWRGHMLFLRRDLVEGFAGNRTIMQVAWGEREVAVDWHAAPAWVRDAQRSHANLWRHVRTLETNQRSSET